MPGDDPFAEVVDVSDRVGSDDEAFMTPGEVARLFGVNPKTVTRWAEAGKLNPIRTLGGHRRYRASEVWALYERSRRGEEDLGARIRPLRRTGTSDD